LMGIISRCENHQLVIATLDMLSKGGNAEAIPFLKYKIAEWEARAEKTPGPVDTDTQVDYFVLSRKAAQVIPRIEERLGIKEGQLKSREKPVTEKRETKSPYF